MSYGSADGVAANSALHSDSGSFTAATTPTLAQVNTWLDEVSALLDTALADQGFTVPVTVAAVVPELDLYVNGIVKDLVDWSHGAGRFFSERLLNAGLSPFITIDKELHAWVQRKTNGFVNQGVPRTEPGSRVATFDLL